MTASESLFAGLKPGDRLMLRDEITSLVLSRESMHGPERGFATPEAGHDETAGYAEDIVDALNDALELSGRRLVLVGFTEASGEETAAPDWSAVRAVIDAPLDEARCEPTAYLLVFR